MQTALYFDYIIDCKVNEKREEIVERAEIDKDRIRSVISSPEYAEGGLLSGRLDTLEESEDESDETTALIASRASKK